MRKKTPLRECFAPTGYLRVPPRFLRDMRPGRGWRPLLDPFHNRLIAPSLSIHGDKPAATSLVAQICLPPQCVYLSA